MRWRDSDLKTTFPKRQGEREGNLLESAGAKDRGTAVPGEYLQRRGSKNRDGGIMAPRVPPRRGKIGPAYRSDRRVDFCVKHVLKHARTSRRIARANRASRERRKSFRNPVESGEDLREAER